MQIGELLQIRKPIDCGDSGEMTLSLVFRILYGAFYGGN